MRKFVVAILLLVLFPSMNVFADVCNDDMIQNAQKDLSTLSIDYELMPKGSTKDVITYNSNVIKKDISYMIKVNLKGLKAGYCIEFIENGQRAGNMICNNSGSTYLKGGVYKVRIYSMPCSTPVKEMEVFIPIYHNENSNKEKWHDGTYEQKREVTEIKKEKKVNKGLVAVAIILLIVTALVIYFLIFRRRKLK